MKNRLKKIAQIGPYPPPSGGWSFRIKLLKEGTNERSGCRSEVLNIGKSRKMKSNEFIGVENGLDYLIKLFWLRFRGYRFHLHANAQAVKGPLLVLTAHLVSILTFSRAAMTFHGGYIQLNFPRKNGGRMFPIIYLNFILSRLIICNDEHIKKDIAEYGPLIGPWKIHPIQAFSKQYINLEKSDLPADIQDYIRGKDKLIACYASFRHGYYLDVICELIHMLPENIGMVITGAGPIEDDHVRPYAEKLIEMDKQNRIVVRDAVDHSQFVTLIEASNLFLRTYISDGVASSVLESLMMKRVVVASDNGQRPQGVVTYPADDVNELFKKINLVFENQEKFEDQIELPEIKDTIKEEINVLLNGLF